jgi:L-threonylcarbamoyladenylate synthase
MEIIKLEELNSEVVRRKIIEKIKEGRIFIYPTDTIYGIGCDATNQKAVSAIKKVKKRRTPMSVIAPSKEWVRDNLVLKHDELMERLPGPYTIILEKKDPSLLKNTSKTNTLGIRIPSHAFTELVEKAGRPFITTSVNFSGGVSITKIEETPKEIMEKTDFIIDAGVLGHTPSKIIDATGDEPKELVR